MSHPSIDKFGQRGEFCGRAAPRSRQRSLRGKQFYCLCSRDSAPRSRVSADGCRCIVPLPHPVRVAPISLVALAPRLYPFLSAGRARVHTVFNGNLFSFGSTSRAREAHFTPYPGGGAYGLYPFCSCIMIVFTCDIKYIYWTRKGSTGKNWAYHLVAVAVVFLLRRAAAPCRGTGQNSLRMGATGQLLPPPPSAGTLRCASVLITR